MRPVHEIAQDVHACATAWVPEACLVGNVRADEIAYLAEYALAAELQRAVATEPCPACIVGVRHGRCPTDVP